MPKQGEMFRGKFMPKNDEKFSADALQFKGTECNWYYNRQIRPGEWPQPGHDGEWIVMPERNMLPFQWTFESDVEKCTK